MQTIAYWTNGFGEEMTSRVYAEFEHGVSRFIVVHDWREGTRGHGFVVLEVTPEIIVRKEMPR